MPGLVIDGKLEHPPGLPCVSWYDDPALRLVAGQDCVMRGRKEVIRGIVLHTTKGIPGGKDQRPQVVRPGLGPGGDGPERCARYWSRDGKSAGAHLVVDFDGRIGCLADLSRDSAFHAGIANSCTIGIEIVQGSAAELYDGQLETVVLLVDWLTRRFRIQRQMPRAYRRRPSSRLVAHPRSFVGVYGHRDCSANRGAGDPGDFIFDRLAVAGYERWDLDGREDLSMWAYRQRQIGVAADGVPGRDTVAALEVRGFPHGLWIERPGDVPDVPPPRVA